MKHKLINYLLIAGALVFSASCAEEDWRGNGASGGDPIEIGEITVKETPQSRAHDNSDNWIWVPNEKIVVTATDKDNQQLGQATYRRNMTNDAWISDSPLQTSVKQDGTVFTVSTVMPSDTEKQNQDDAYNYVLTDYVMATGDEVSFDTDGKLTAKLKHRTVDVVAVLTKGDGWDSDEAFYEALSGCSATFYAGGTYAVKGFAVSGNDDSVDYNDNAGEESIAPGKKTYIFRAHLDAAQLAAGDGSATPLLQLTGLYSDDQMGKYTRPDGVENGKRLTVTFSVDAPNVDITRSATSGDSSLKSGVAVVQDWLGKRALYGMDNVWDGTITEPAYDESTETYTIKTGAELAWIGKNVTTVRTKTVKLANDINLGESGWTPIGGSAPDFSDSFGGTFDGGGFTIHITNGKSLFNKIGDTGTVKNLGIAGSLNASGSIAASNNGTIEYCYTSVTITTPSQNNGGIVNTNLGTIQYCYSSAKISNGAISGGIAAINGDKTAGTKGTIANCYSTGLVTAVYGGSGGIAGTNYGSVSNCYATGSVEGLNAGGIVGKNYSGATIQNCIALNASITGKAVQGMAPTSGRVVSYNDKGTLGTNYASPLISGTWSEGGVDGDDLTNTNFTNVRDASGAFTNWPTGDEGWDLTTNNLPTLKGFKGDQPVKDIARKSAIQKLISIATAAELEVFRDAVNSGNTYDGETVLLTANITVDGWETSIGNSNSYLYFTGTFDGDGHVITMTKATTSLFGAIGTDGTVMNLGVNADINATVLVGGIATINKGTIKRCYTEGKIESDQNKIGGIAHSNQGTIEDCYSTASIETTGIYAGGITGENYNGTIQRCYATGAISSKVAGGIVGSGNTNDTIQNCIALNKSIAGGTGTDAPFRIVGSTGSSPIYANNYASPAISGTWTNKVHDQKNGADLDKSNFISTEAGQGAFVGWGTTTAWDFGDNTNLPTLKGFTANQPVKDITRAKAIAKPLITSIATADDLEAFRASVNDGGDYTDKIVILTANITVTGWKEGIDKFKGTFDGQGHVIDLTGSISLFNQIGEYGSTAGTVQNLGVKATITKTAIGKSIGAIAETNFGTIRQCYTEGSIEGGNIYAGGIVGTNKGTVQDCYSTVAITVKQGAGGIVEVNRNGGTVQRCYATGAITGGDKIGGIAGKNIDGSITQCIALNASITDATGNASLGRITGTNSSTLTTNYASPLIPGGWNNIDAGKIDGADLTVDNFIDKGTGLGVEVFEDWSVYVWDFSVIDNLPSFKGFQGSQPASSITRADFLEKPLTIATAADLMKFSEAVKGGNTYKGKTVILTAPITLTGDWTPIGNANKMFNGTFEGGGHCISGLSVTINGSGDQYGGLFGCIDSKGIVQNLGVKGTVSVTSTNSLAHAGGITGSNNGTIQNCYTDVTVTASTGDLSKNSFAGGIAGINNNKISNCYTRGNSTAVTFAGGIAGRNTKIIEQCYATGAVKATHMGIGSAGGIGGNSLDGSSYTKCIALNSSIITEEYRGRISGSGKSNFAGNYASPAIAGTWNNIAADGIDGETLTWTNYKSATNGWSSASWNSVGNSAKLPTLKGFGTRQPAALLRWVSFLP